MKKLNNTDAELKKSIAYNKCVQLVLKRQRQIRDILQGVSLV